MLTSNILRVNSEVVCRTLVHHLTPDEMQLTGLIKQMADCNANIRLKLGNATTEADFDPSVLTPIYDAYKPHDVYTIEGTPDLISVDQVPAAPPEETTPTPEIGDTYLGAGVMLPRGGTLLR